MRWIEDEEDRSGMKSQKRDGAKSHTTTTSSIINKKFQRSISPSGKFCSSTISSSLSSPVRSLSPNRITMHSLSSSSPSVRFSIDHNKNNNRNGSVSLSGKRNGKNKKTCLCSPTTHPGSFRCSLHRNVSNGNSSSNTVSYHSHRLYARRSAMTNSLVRIGTVEGELVKRALAALIRPSSHQQRRRCDFEPKPSRLSVMSKADE
uniref:uncharacterized protein LOC122588342 n=1 Tax=Erigeron canadensis TaxID=72917 RepID=UPI001CB9325F|nr:uncharacterized protein LOC122588342 [Erigeron canadensis]